MIASLVRRLTQPRRYTARMHSLSVDRSHRIIPTRARLFAGKLHA